ncbi:MAG TPA: FAD-dependent oxidoreductase, partial [Gemmatimonadales bacterium]|nr:FAD-dependent oxidoreductase [Gemmatimonadales bacterium]
MATVIVGAGVAGLTIANQLSSRGHDVTVLEKHAVVGGLGRTWHYGDFHFDVGPHRFHTENPRVAAFIREILQEDAIEIPRRSGARMFGRFHEWPLTPGILLSLPFSLMLRSTRDLLFKERLPGESFEADVINKYGRGLYDVFFAPYTLKFLGYPASQLHRDWARAGVNRAVIDKRAQSDTLWSLLRNTLMPKPVHTMFLYPPHGVGRFSDRIVETLTARGARVRVGAAVTGVEADGAQIRAVRVGGERIACDHLVWTAPMTELTAHLGVPAPDLEYLSTIFYNVEVNAPDKFEYQWIYYGGDEIFSRVSLPGAFAKTTVPPGTSGLCVEVTCREGDERWQAPERLTDAVIDDLVRTGTLDAREQVRRVHIERVPFTYPIYKLNYLDELARTLRALGRWRNLLMAGRTGRFWYNNMDHSIG